ncbi:MAG: leucyl aminopeptidase [Candidatus Methylomirabilales bacterium]
MEIRVERGDVTAVRADALVVNLFEGTVAPGRRARGPGRVLSGATAAVDAALGGAIAGLIRSGEAKGTWGEQTLLHTLGRLPAGRVLVLGLGKPEEFGVDRVRMAAGEAARQLRKIGARRVASVVHGAGAGGLDPAAATQALVEGTLLGLYRFMVYKGNGGEQAEIASLTLLERDAAKLPAMRRAVRRGSVLAEATNAARDLVNEPGNTLTPRELAARARAMARRAGLGCRVLGPAQIARLGMGGLLGVARGSQEPPQLIVLQHRPRARGPHLGLVGKGITFDSGGISIKPAENMGAMKGDMAGAAAVLAAMTAIATLQLPLRVTGVIPATENLPSGSALKPGDILRMMSGTTVEVVNTDAEGRLVLADALHYARRLGATHLVDAATLTGACVVALGSVNTGAFGGDARLLETVTAAARAAGEKIWPLPLDPEYDELIKSDVADIKNSGGRKGGAVTAAKFLQRFVGDTPWVHLDIAGTVEAEKEKGYQPRGATGVMVRTFVGLAEELTVSGR